MGWKTFAAEVGEQPAPGFALLSQRGHLVRREDYRQHASLVLFFGHGADCAACRVSLSALATAYPAIHEREAEVLAVFPQAVGGAGGAVEMLAPPFLVLADTGGAVAARYAPLLGTAGPGVIVLDRYGAPRAAQAGHVAGDTLGEVLEWLDLLGHECPE